MVFLKITNHSDNPSDLNLNLNARLHKKWEAIRLT